MVPESILHLPNNTHKWWFRDPGLRKLAIAILLGFASPINSGERESGERERGPASSVDQRIVLPWDL
jgi:hypothetical protein